MVDFVKLKQWYYDVSGIVCRYSRISVSGSNIYCAGYDAYGTKHIIFLDTDGMNIQMVEYETITTDRSSITKLPVSEFINPSLSDEAKLEILLRYT